MAEFELRLEVVARIEAATEDEARRAFWDSEGLSHYIDGEDVIVEVREVETVS